jgi:hypothetical protein
MAIYNPPNFSEYISTFNPTNWGVSSGNIDIEFLNANFANYPVIQGTNYTMKNTKVSSITFPDNTVQTTASNVGLVSITSFGAIGDGTTDCTTAINNAIATLAGGNKTLYIPQGKFKISGSLIFQGTNVGASLTPLRNVNIFSEGTLLATGSSYNAIYISNVDKFSINGNLVIDGTGSSGITAIRVSDVSNGAGGWYEAIFNLNISNITVSYCDIGIYIQATGFSPKIYSDLIFYSVTTAIENRGEYNLFNNVNATVGSIGILNYGGNNTYSNGMIKQYAYGAIVAYNGAISNNPDHGGFYNIIFNHNGRVGIILHYINLNWVVSNCTIYANGPSALDNPLNLIPVAYQSYACSGIYIQGCSRVSILNNVFGLNQPNPLSINGSNNCVISNNQFFQVSGSTYISVIGTTIQGSNFNNTFTNNSFASNFTENTIPAITYSNSIDASTISLSSNNIVANNTGNILTLKIFNNTGASTTQYIDGSVPFYRIVAGQTDTLYLTNIVAGSEFEIQFTRGAVAFNSATTYTDVLILNSGFGGGVNAVPTLCDGLEGTDNGAGTQIIRFYKAGTYSFRPSSNTGITNNTGQYTVFPTFSDPQLYFSPTLFTASPIRLDSALFFNSVVDIGNGQATPNTNVTLPAPNFGSSSHYVGATLQIFNNTSVVLTLNRPASSGLFKGAYGNDNTSISLPDNTWTTITFDGTDYLINERSANYNYQLTGVSAGVSYTSNFNFTNATVNLSLTSAGLVNIPIPSSKRCHQTSIIFNNIGVHQFTLQITSGTFSGNYGSGGTQLIVPVGCWVQIYSDATNWRVDDRSSNFNINLYSASTAFNWSSDFQYLDNQIELVPADDALNTSANITGGGTMSGYVFTFTSLSGTGLGAGSIFSVNTAPTRKYIILCQVGGTLGGLGSYYCNFAGDYPTTVATTMRPNLTTNSSGNLTQGALTTQTGIYSTATFTSGTPFAGMTVGVPIATIIGNIPFYVINNTSGTSWNVSTNSTATLGSTAWFGNRGNTITLPNPSTSLIGRTFTLINNSGTMTNITSSSGTALFGGRYGQMILNTTTVASNYPVGAFPTNYLLRPNQTVVLRCDGTQWETQERTSLGEQRAYCNNISVTTSTADGTVANYPFYNYDQTYSNLSGLINITNGTSPAWCNLYPFPLTLQLTFSFTWASVAVAGNILPSRTILVTCYGAGITGFVSTNANTLTIPCTVASPNFTTILGDNIQYYTATITLRSFEVFVVQISKRDGSGTGRTTGFSSMFIKRLS